VITRFFQDGFLKEPRDHVAVGSFPAPGLGATRWRSRLLSG